MMFPPHQLKRQPRRTRRFRSVPLLAISAQAILLHLRHCEADGPLIAGYGQIMVPAGGAAPAVRSTAAARHKRYSAKMRKHGGAGVCASMKMLGQTVQRKRCSVVDIRHGIFASKSIAWAARVCSYLILLEKPASVYPGRVISFIRGFSRRVLPPSGKGGRRSAR